MILSASRRTDIPAHYFRWMVNRLREGYLLVRNPYNARQVYRIDITPDTVDGIVFWTKNPQNCKPFLGAFSQYPLYFQFTITPYGQELEPGLPEKRVLTDIFCDFAGTLTPKQMVWRYDPILISSRYTVQYHIRSFSAMAERLAGSTERCVISFLDNYRQISRAADAYGFRPPTDDEIHEICAAIAPVAEKYGIQVQTCCEKIDLTAYNITRGACIDAHLMGEISGNPLHHRLDRNQRAGCGCCEAVDIANYQTCTFGCRYCYAGGGKSAWNNAARYDELGDMLCDQLMPGERVITRQMPSLADLQLRLF